MPDSFADFVEACLARRASRQPDRIALADVASGAALDGRALYARVGEVARSLPRREGGDVPLYFLPSANGLDKVVLWLGAWMAGAAVLNIDTEFLPSDVVRTLLAAARPTAVLSLGPGGADYLPLSERRSALPAGTVQVNCTSGTTGMPKLVYQSAAALRHNGEVSARLMALDEGEPCLEVRGMNWYSAQILSLMPFLLRDTQLHVAAGFSASRLTGWLADRGIRFMPMVPSMVRIMLGMADALPSLTRLSCSSSELAADIWEHAEQAWQVPLINLYGSSELGWMCGSNAACRQVGRVGFPIEGVGVELARPAGAAPDAPGRILVSSPYAALATRLVHENALRPCPAPVDTQDVGRFDASGRLTVLGRADDMILRGGVNIHPGEIERQVEGMAGVRQAVVFGVEDATYGAVVGCAFTGTPGLQANDLAIQLATRLPPAWQPVYWWKLESIPLGANGKVSRRLLRQQLTESLPPPLALRSGRRNAARPPALPCARSDARPGARGTAD
ncbi:Surfactin synthase subunit 2 [Pigmentiphaga humi]|uniref:Surfactin synthase subunit 2 n=1 Tax=Pigmentiphaga humi TaxID=2478468 RepID=A0A3P4B5L3_9BURK|nr:Surfactin synthase subunit 2 [Pigmentiphaga humi]